MSKKLVIFVVILAVIAAGVAYYLYIKARRDEKDRLVLGGLTRNEFLDSLKRQWESEYRNAMTAYISDSGTDWNRAIIDLMQNEFMHLNSTEYEAEYQRRIDAAVDWAWEQNPKPIDIDWARQYWLPRAVDNMNVNINDKLVQELISKI